MDHTGHWHSRTIQETDHGSGYLAYGASRHGKLRAKAELPAKDRRQLRLYQPFGR